MAKRFTARRVATVLLALLSVLGLATVNAVPASAVANGHHTVLKQVNGNGSYVLVNIDYDITFGSNVEVNWFSWDAQGNQLLDAICVDYEVFANNYAGNYCGYVGSSSTASSANYDDIPNTGTYSPGAGERVFENGNSPAFRIRVYGLNNQHTRDDGFVAM